MRPHSEGEAVELSEEAQWWLAERLGGQGPDGGSWPAIVSTGALGASVFAAIAAQLEGCNTVSCRTPSRSHPSAGDSLSVVVGECDWARVCAMLSELEPPVCVSRHTLHLLAAGEATASAELLAALCALHPIPPHYSRSKSGQEFLVVSLYHACPAFASSADGTPFVFPLPTLKQAVLRPSHTSWNRPAVLVTWCQYVEFECIFFCDLLAREPFSSARMCFDLVACGLRSTSQAVVQHAAQALTAVCSCDVEPSIKPQFWRWWTSYEGGLDCALAARGLWQRKRPLARALDELLLASFAGRWKDAIELQLLPRVPDPGLFVGILRGLANAHDRSVSDCPELCFARVLARAGVLDLLVGHLTEYSARTGACVVFVLDLAVASLPSFLPPVARDLSALSRLLARLRELSAGPAACSVPLLARVAVVAGDLARAAPCSIPDPPGHLNPLFTLHEMQDALLRTCAALVENAADLRAVRAFAGCLLASFGKAGVPEQDLDQSKGRADEDGRSGSSCTTRAESSGAPGSLQPSAAASPVDGPLGVLHRVASHGGEGVVQVAVTRIPHRTKNKHNIDAGSPAPEALSPSQSVRALDTSTAQQRRIKMPAGAGASPHNNPLRNHISPGAEALSRRAFDTSSTLHSTKKYIDAGTHGHAGNWRKAGSPGPDALSPLPRGRALGVSTKPHRVKNTAGAEANPRGSPSHDNGSSQKAAGTAASAAPVGLSLYGQLLVAGRATCDLPLQAAAIRIAAAIRTAHVSIYFRAAAHDPAEPLRGTGSRILPPCPLVAPLVPVIPASSGAAARPPAALAEPDLFACVTLLDELLHGVSAAAAGGQPKPKGRDAQPPRRGGGASDRKAAKRDTAETLKAGASSSSAATPTPSCTQQLAGGDLERAVLREVLEALWVVSARSGSRRCADTAKTAFCWWISAVHSSLSDAPVATDGGERVRGATPATESLVTQLAREELLDVAFSGPDTHGQPPEAVRDRLQARTTQLLALFEALRHSPGVGVALAAGAAAAGDAALGVVRRWWAAPASSPAAASRLLPRPRRHDHAAHKQQPAAAIVQWARFPPAAEGAALAVKAAARVARGASGRADPSPASGFDKALQILAARARQGSAADRPLLSRGFAPEVGHGGGHGGGQLGPVPSFSTLPHHVFKSRRLLLRDAPPASDALRASIMEGTSAANDDPATGELHRGSDSASGGLVNGEDEASHAKREGTSAANDDPATGELHRGSDSASGGLVNGEDEASHAKREGTNAANDDPATEELHRGADSASEGRGEGDDASDAKREEPNAPNDDSAKAERHRGPDSASGARLAEGDDEASHAKERETSAANDDPQQQHRDGADSPAAGDRAASDGNDPALRASSESRGVLAEMKDGSSPELEPPITTDNTPTTGSRPNSAKATTEAQNRENHENDAAVKAADNDSPPSASDENDAALLRASSASRGVLPMKDGSSPELEPRITTDETPTSGSRPNSVKATEAQNRETHENDAAINAADTDSRPSASDNGFAGREADTGMSDNRRSHSSGDGRWAEQEHSTMSGTSDSAAAPSAGKDKHAKVPRKTATVPVAMALGQRLRPEKDGSLPPDEDEHLRELSARARNERKSASLAAHRRAAEKKRVSEETEKEERVLREAEDHRRRAARQRELERIMEKAAEKSAPGG
ncbi:hypothetical protein DIPPA_10603 [Diplonema papillatum]|nr:hypothetical protein DIPPA_10603 [Diplonema papillatum]